MLGCPTLQHPPMTEVAPQHSPQAQERSLHPSYLLSDSAAQTAAQTPLPGLETQQAPASTALPSAPAAMPALDAAAPAHAVPATPSPIACAPAATPSTAAPSPTSAPPAARRDFGPSGAALQAAAALTPAPAPAPEAPAPALAPPAPPQAPFTTCALPSLQWSPSSCSTGRLQPHPILLASPRHGTVPPATVLCTSQPGMQATSIPGLQKRAAAPVTSQTHAASSAPTNVQTSSAASSQDCTPGLVASTHAGTAAAQKTQAEPAVLPAAST
eukprot:scaffold224879_cov16-Tisochrysis_lutea.AAC.1